MTRVRLEERSVETMLDNVSHVLHMTRRGIWRILNKVPITELSIPTTQDLQFSDTPELREIDRRATDWHEKWPKQSTDSTETFIKFVKIADKTDLCSNEGQKALDEFFVAQDERAQRRSKIPTAAELDLLLGPDRSTDLQKAHRLADNIRSIQRDKRNRP